MSDPGVSLDALMAAAQRGDEVAYRTLLQALAVALRQFFSRWLGEEAAAEDLVQETLVALHRRRRTYDPRRPFADWLFAIARYKLMAHLRFKGGRLSPPAEAFEAGADRELAASVALDLDRRMVVLFLSGRDLVASGRGQAMSGDRPRVPVLRISALRMRLQRLTKVMAARPGSSRL